MADLATLEAAFMKADEAGNTEDARVFANEIRRLRAVGVSAPTKPSTMAANIPGAIGEPLLKMATGAVAKPISEIGALGSMVAPRLYHGKSPEQVKAEVAQTFTYEPRTSWGKAVAESPYSPINLLGQGIGSVAEKAHKLVGGEASPETLRGMAANAVQEAIPQALAVAGLKAPAAVQRGVGQAGLLGLPLAYDVAKAGLKGVYNLAEPHLPGWATRGPGTGLEQVAGRTMNELAGSKQPPVVQALLAARETVPGSAPTAGQAAVVAGSPQFSALQSVAQKAAPSAYEPILQAQQGAHEAAIGSIAKTEGALNAAIKVRKLADEANYEAAGKQVVKSDATLRDLLSRPSMDKAIAQAENIAKERGDVFRFGKDIPEHTETSAIVGPSGQAIEKTVPASTISYPVQTLHYIKLGLDDLLTTPERFALGKTQEKGIAQTKAAFTKWLSEKSPAYEFARSEHARLSEPINRMQVGQVLREKLMNPSGKETPGAYLGALDDAAKTIAQATGYKRHTGFADVLSPEQIRAATAVATELDRGLRLKELSGRGMQATSEHLRSAFQPVDWPGTLLRPMMIAHYIMDRIQGHAGTAARDTIAEAMKNPARAAELMQQAKMPVAQRNQIRQALLQRTGQAAAGSIPMIAAQRY